MIGQVRKLSTRFQNQVSQKKKKLGKDREKEGVQHTEQRAQWAWDQGPGHEGIQHSQRQNTLETAARDWA